MGKTGFGSNAGRTSKRTQKKKFDRLNKGQTRGGGTG